MILQKDLLRPGSYRKGQNVHIVKDEDIQEMQESVAAFNRLGYKLPLWMDHPSVKDRLSHPIPTSDQNLIKAAESDPFFSGWLHGIHTDGANALHVELDVPDELGERLAKTGTFVSPQFGPWESPDKSVNFKRAALHHIAFTRSPVNQDQTRSFIPVSAPGDGVPKNSQNGIDRLSNLMNDPATIRQMSLQDAIDQGMTEFRFSLGDQMNEDENPDGDDKSKTGKVPGQTDQLPPAQPTQDDLLSKLQTLQDVLGLVLGLLKSSTLGQPQNPQNLTDPNPTDPKLSEQSTVVAMSQTPTDQTPNAPAAPGVSQAAYDELNNKVVQMSNAMVTQDKVNTALCGIISSQRQEAYRGRIENIKKTGRCTVPDAEALLAEVGTYQFSLASDPNAKSALDLRLEIFEKLPEGAFLTPEAKLKQFSIAETPVGGMSSFYNGGTEPTADRVDEIMKELGMVSTNPFLAALDK